MGKQADKRKQTENKVQDTSQPKKQKKADPDDTTEYAVNGKGKVTVRISCNPKKVLSQHLREEFKKSTRVEFARKFKIAFIKFETEEDLQAAVGRKEVKVVGVPVQVMINPDKKIKGPEGKVVGDLLKLLAAILLKHLHMDCHIVNMSSSIIAEVPLAQAKKAFNRDLVKIGDQSVQTTYHVRDILPEGAKPKNG